MIQLSDKVIDISYANDVDLMTLKSQIKIKGVIIRTGYKGKTDDKFKRYIEQAIQCGLDIGAYTYLVAQTVEQEMQEADEAATLLMPYREYINMPIFADIEDTRYYYQSGVVDGKTATEIVNTYIKWLDNHCFVGGLYTNPAYLEYYLDRKKLKYNNNLWLAHWKGSLTNPPESLQKYKPIMWQYGTNAINGHKIDMDIADGTLTRRTKTAMSERIKHIGY